MGPPPGSPIGAGVPGGAPLPGGPGVPADLSSTYVGPSQIPANALRLRVAGRPYLFVPGRTVVVGRETQADVHVDNPRVSRRHAQLRWDGSHWLLEDLGSSTGVFVNGTRQQSVTLGGDMKVWLGPVGEGQDLDITAPGSAPAAAGSGGSGARIGLVVVGVVAVLALVAGAVALLRKNSETTASTSLDPRAVRAATVRVDIDNGSGSGSIISSDGLVLTNAHVAAPTALGQGVEVQSPADKMEKDPKKIEIATSNGDDGQPAQKAYEAEVLAADGYLDVAVLQITRDKDGKPVDRSSLNLPTLPIGDSRQIKQDQAIRAVGFPGIAESKGATITRGEVAGFIDDPRLNDTRAWINTSAAINPGNSGGAAVDENGALIGIPTLGVRKGNREAINRLRSIHLAEPVIAAARARRDNPSAPPYASPNVVKKSGSEDIDFSGFQWIIQSDKPNPDKLFTLQGECPPGNTRSRSTSGTIEARSLAVALPYSGFPTGSLDVLVVVVREGRSEPIAVASNARQYGTPWNGNGCMVVTFDDIKDLPQSGDVVAVFGGGNYEEIAEARVKRGPRE